MTGLPTDVTPLLSLAGIWQPIPDQYVTPQNNGDIANTFPENIRLPNGREGIVVTGWSYSGFSNSATSITPVNIAILEQQQDGTLQLATSKYVSDPQTNGGGSVIVADFNHDGVQDFFLPAHNESPALPASSTAYLSSGATYSRMSIDDQVEAHGATLAEINGTPTVFTASYYVVQRTDPSKPETGHANTVAFFNGTDFSVIPDTGVGGTSSVAVADFYGTGTYSIVYGDFKYGPQYPFSPTQGIYLYNLSGLLPSGNPINVGTPYFNGKPEYAQYPSFLDPVKTHNYRLWVDDFNHDGKQDLIVGGMIWAPSLGEQKNILQMLQNNGGYPFTDVTDALNTEYDKNCNQIDYVPQLRDIDNSGIKSYLFASVSFSAQAPCNYVMVNDGTGNLHVALYQTLNRYGQQVKQWVAANGHLFNLVGAPKLRAYQTANGLLNFVAIVRGQARLPDNTLENVIRFCFVNVPVQLDIARQFTEPMTIVNRNGSHRIRTFAGDDTIYAGSDNSESTVDGGLGTNTVVYSGPSQNYSVTKNSDGSWTVKDRVGRDGTDILRRIQRLQFTDVVLPLVFTDDPYAKQSVSDPHIALHSSGVAARRHAMSPP